jgi:hypothetical protein
VTESPNPAKVETIATKDDGVLPPWISWSPLVLFVLFLLATSAFVSFFALDATDLHRAASNVAAFRDRIGWSVSVLVLVLCLLWNSLVSAMVIHVLLKAEEKLKRGWLLVFVFLIVVLVPVAMFGHYASRPGEDLIDRAHDDSTVPVHIIVDPKHCCRGHDHDRSGGMFYVGTPAKLAARHR